MVKNIYSIQRIQGTLCFYGMRKLLKNPECINYRLFNTLKNFRVNSLSRASASCSKILKDNQYSNAVKIFRANSVFQGKLKLFKILNDKKYLNAVKSFRANSVFQGKLKLFKILNDKKYMFNAVSSGHTLFSRANASWLNILNVKRIFNTVKNFRANSVYQGKRKLFKILNDKKYIFDEVNSGHTVFQGKRKLLKNPECKKYIQYSEKFQGKLCFQGKRKLFKNPER